MKTNPNKAAPHAARVRACVWNALCSIIVLVRVLVIFVWARIFPYLLSLPESTKRRVCVCVCVNLPPPPFFFRSQLPSRRLCRRRGVGASISTML